MSGIDLGIDVWIRVPLEEITRGKSGIKRTRAFFSLVLRIFRY